MELQPYRLALDVIMRAYANLLRDVIAAVYTPDTREDALTRLAPIIYRATLNSREQAREASVRFLTAEARRQGVTGEVYIPGTTRYERKVVEEVLREVLRGPTPQATQAITERMIQHVEGAARQTIARAVEDGMTEQENQSDAPLLWSRLSPEELAEELEDDEPDGDDLDARFHYYMEQEREARTYKRSTPGLRPKAWARVLTGAENCGMCVMLASRGAVYLTEESAGARQRVWKDVNTGASRYINSFHPNCDCMVVPVYDRNDWPGMEQQEQLEEIYEKAIDQEWEDENGRVRHGITYNSGPGRGERNQVIDAINRELSRRRREGIPFPVAELRG